MGKFKGSQTNIQCMLWCARGTCTPAADRSHESLANGHQASCSCCVQVRGSNLRCGARAKPLLLRPTGTAAPHHTSASKLVPTSAHLRDAVVKLLLELAACPRHTVLEAAAPLCGKASVRRNVRDTSVGQLQPRHAPLAGCRSALRRASRQWQAKRAWGRFCCRRAPCYTLVTPAAAPASASGR